MKTAPNLLHTLGRLRRPLADPITLGLRLILERAGTVLLVKHTGQPFWQLPGGAVRRGETMEEAARRRASEKVGAKLGELDLFGVYSNSRENGSDHTVVFCCQDVLLAGEIDPGIECLDYFGPDSLPRDVSPGTLRRIREYVNGGRWPYVGCW